MRALFQTLCKEIYEKERNPVNSNNKILLIDQSGPTRRYLKKLFKQKFESEIMEAGNVKEALELMKNKNLWLVFAELNMLMENNYELLTSLKIKNNLKKTPHIFATTYHLVDNKLVLKNAGIKDIITKPFSINILEKKINSQLGTYP